MTAGARLGPEGLEQCKDSRLLRCQPQSAGQAELDRSGRQRHRRGAILDQPGNTVCGTQVSLMNDARLAVDARTLDDVVVDGVGLFLLDKGRNTG